MYNLLNRIIENKKYHFWIFFAILLFLTLFTMYCCGPTKSYSGYDFFFHYRRFDVLIDALKDGSYPIYIDYKTIEGYGYFSRGFYPGAVLLPFAVIGTFTSTYFAYDLMIFTMTILCGVFSYKVVRIIYKKTFAATIAALLYTFCTYRLYDVYQRAALGEALSFTFIPIVLLGVYHILLGDYKKWYILAIGYSLLIYTHLIASILMFITLLPFVAYYYKSFVKQPKRIWYLLLAVGVTIAIISFYLLPTLEQVLSGSFYYQTHTPGGRAGYNKYSFDLVAQGFISGLSYPSGRMFCGTGILLTIAICLRIFVRKKSSVLRRIDLGVIIGLLYIFATSSIFPWGRFPFNLLGFIQYPWRLYEFSSLFFAVAGGYYLSIILKTNKQKVITVIITTLLTIPVIINHSENFKELDRMKVLQFYEGDSDEKPDISNRYHLIGQEYLPSRIPSLDFLHERGLRVEAKNADTKIENLRRENRYTRFDISVNESDTIELPIISYKGYSVTLNGNALATEQSENGLVQVAVNQSGRVEAYYAGTSVQKISWYISVISLLLFCGYLVYINRKIMKRRRKQ